jgi:hypothetical protein
MGIGGAAVSALIRTYDALVCWLARHPEGLLVLNFNLLGRVVNGNHGEGVTMQATNAIVENPKRARWLRLVRESPSKCYQLSGDGEMYHRQLVGQKKCTCPKCPLCSLPLTGEKFFHMECAKKENADPEEFAESLPERKEARDAAAA